MASDLECNAEKLKLTVCSRESFINNDFFQKLKEEVISRQGDVRAYFTCNIILDKRAHSKEKCDHVTSIDAFSVI